MSCLNDEHIAILRGELIKKYRREREGVVHNSDILYCDRQAFYRRKDPHSSITDKELFFFSRGEAFHMIVEKMFVGNHPERFQIEETKVTDYKLSYTPDIYDIQRNMIIDIKTSNKSEITEANKENRIQLWRYMALTGAKFGKLLYILQQNYENPFRTFTFTLPETKRRTILTDLKDRTARLLEAERQNNAAMVPGVRESSLKFKCNDCKYRKECDEIEEFLRVSKPK